MKELPEEYSICINSAEELKIVLNNKKINNEFMIDVDLTMFGYPARIIIKNNKYLTWGYAEVDMSMTQWLSLIEENKNET